MVITFLDQDIATHLVLVLMLLLVGVTSSKKSLRLHRYKSDRNEIWRDCYSSKHASIDRVRFRLSRHTFKMRLWP